MNARLKEICEQNPSKVRAEVLAVSLGGLPVPLLTITEDVASYLKYSEQIALQTKLPPVVKKQFKAKYQSSRKLIKQASESKEKVQRLLRAAFEEEMVSFVD
jgi:hypothetical protein